DFVGRVGELAETENHHPDMHVTGYRNVTIELSTHALHGLTENDFILAAKIDALSAPLAAGSHEAGQAQAHWKPADSAPDEKTAAMQRATRAAEPHGRT
ncbi:MAG TPA: 4a-hydroxytetrahydrobiopterin dehydratase, partial [Planctomycetaceae bacterium]|nr:4a-hydroxytetrahydrobiopterin dehydratase [Planctomycetaceae bacterium]